MDYFEIQKKYRNKRIKLIGSFFLKIFILIFVLIVGWRIGASDNDILIQENEKILKDLENIKIDLEQKLISTKMKLKESNLALEAKNIREGSSEYGLDSKKILSIALAKGVSEEKIINHLRILTNNKVCQNQETNELPVSTESFVPPNSTLTLLGGSLRIKAQGFTRNKTIDKPFFDQNKPLLVTLMFFGGKENIEKKLPIKKEIIANKFSIKLNIIKSSLRGSVLVNYKVCRS